MQGFFNSRQCNLISTLSINIVRNQSTKKNPSNLKRVIKTNYNFALERKWPAISSSFGPLTNSPDYRFKDGRVVPYNAGQVKRIEQQKLFFETIKQMVTEIDDAVAFHKLELQTEEEKRHYLLDRKLKAKGNKLCNDVGCTEPGEWLQNKHKRL